MTRSSCCGVAINAGGRFGARRLVAVIGIVLLAFISLGAHDASEDDSTVTVNDVEGVYHVTARFTVPEAPSYVVATLTDYADIPRFMPDVRASNIIERDDERTLVEQEAVARFMMFSKRVHLVLEVQEARGSIRFRDRCGKSFVRYEGVWTIAERGGATHITYELAATPSFDVPELLLKRLFKRDAVQMIERLKREITARARRLS